nr:MAG TPA: hypothetical protein [Caudoviricetes sp.]
MPLGSSAGMILSYTVIPFLIPLFGIKEYKRV